MVDFDRVRHGPGRVGRRQLSNQSACQPQCQLAKLLPPYLWPILSCVSANLRRAFESAPAVVITLPPRCYYERDSSMGGCTRLRSVFVCVFVRTAHFVETVNSATTSQSVGQPARAPIPGHPATRATVSPRGVDSSSIVDKPPSLGQIPQREREKISSRRAEEAVIAMTGIKEAAKNEWTSNVRCCISRVCSAW